MTNNHNLHHSKNKWNNAIPERRQLSSLQRENNRLNKKINELLFILETKNYALKKHGEVFNKLVEEKIVSKSYLKPYLPRVKESYEYVKSKAIEVKK